MKRLPHLMALMILLVISLSLAVTESEVEFKNVPCTDFEKYPPTHATFDFGNRSIYYVSVTYPLKISNMDIGTTYMLMGAFKDPKTGLMMYGDVDPFKAEEKEVIIDVTFLPEDAGPGGFGLQESDGRTTQYSAISFHVENNWLASLWEKIMNWFKR
jgi:hypothetical protein